MGESLGEGASSRVYLCGSLKDNHKFCALKLIKSDSTDQNIKSF